jgi:hypothetical protein
LAELDSELVQSQIRGLGDVCQHLSTGWPA